MTYLLEKFADWIVIDLLTIQQNTLLANALIFFIADVIKIFILLVVIIFIVSYIRSYLPQEKIKKILSHKHQFTGNILASIFGIFTPFCTCSAIPLFLGFIEAGVPLGVTFSFLVASPMINEVVFVLLLGMFGFKIALIYVISGLIIAILAGLIIGKLNPEKLLEKFDYNNKSVQQKLNTTIREKLIFARNYTTNIINKVWLYIIVGVGLGAFIHGYVPINLLTQYIGINKWYGVPFATLLGVPLYSNAAGIIPLVGALVEKGMPIGTALAFMMAVIGLSLPEFMILKRIMKPKLIIIFATIVTLGIIFTGYLFNFILK
jgi:hypothetical protein